MEMSSSTEDVPVSVAKNRLKMACTFLGISILALAGTGGYFAYRKIQASNSDGTEPSITTANAIQNSVQSSKTSSISSMRITTQMITPMSSKTVTTMHAKHTSTSNMNTTLENTNTVINTAFKATSTEQTTASTLATPADVTRTSCLSSSLITTSILSSDQSSFPASASTTTSTVITAEQTSTGVIVPSTSTIGTIMIPFEQKSTEPKTTKLTTKPNTIKSTTDPPPLCTISIASLHLNVSCVHLDPCQSSSAICSSGSVMGTLPKYCECEADGVWTIIQKRFDESVDFNRNWTEYKEGFGDINGEYWLGNDAIYQITSGSNYKLKIFITAWDNVTKYAVYDIFKIADEYNGYRLTINGFSGDAGDSLTLYSNEQMFSTKDNDNDRQKSVNMAVGFSGAWWFGSQTLSNLNGPYQFEPESGDYGIMWGGYGNTLRYSMKETKMQIKMQSNY